MVNLSEWLDSVGLGQYAEAFDENDISWETLPSLDHDLLKEIGVRSVGHRVALLKAIDTLEGDGTDQSLDEASPETRQGPEAERRQLTVMFCDLVGSTSLSEAMDTEDYRDLLGAYQTAAAGAIHEHEGYIARYMGDGLLVYFGYPMAQENDPERAARAGLAIIDALACLDAPVPLEVRVGIATGPVVVGDIVGEGASEEAAALGETPNLAARLQGAAAPNTVLLSPTTRELLQGRVETEALEPVELKGLSRPITPYRAIRPRSLSEVSENRLDSTPLIGRDVEIALLLRAWQHAQRAEGQAVLLSGEPGVGKSRLLRTFQECLDEASRTQVQWYCSPYFQTTANYPAIEQLKHTLGPDGQSDAQDLEALEHMVRALRRDIEDLVPPLALLLSVPLDDRYAAPDLAPDELKRRLMRAQLELLLAAAKLEPVLLIVEDLHWADATTLEVLGEIIEAIRDERVMILMTARPEFGSPWADRPHVVTQALSSLTRSETKALIQGILDENSLNADVIEEIVARTDGVPLFIEELTKSLLESSGEAGIPASLQDSLMARLDRPGPAKELAQTASVIGRAFSFDALSPLVPWPLDSVEQGLGQLLDSGLVHRRSGGGFEFKHALIRDAAYDSMLRAPRRAIHLKYAELLDTTDVASESEALVALHYAEAGNGLRALELYRAAGETAMQRSADVEAAQHLTEALRLMQEEPEGLDRDRLELSLRAALGPALVAIDGFAGAKSVENMTRAAEICGRINDAPEEFAVLWTLARIHNTRAEYAPAKQLGARILDAANSETHSGQTVAANALYGTTLYLAGDLEDAHHYLAQGADLYSQKGHGHLAVRYGTDLGMMCLGRGALVQWRLGLIDTSLAAQKRMLEIARASGHAMTIVFALEYAAQLHQLRGENDALRSLAEQLIAKCEEVENVRHICMGEYLKGSALCEQGDIQNGLGSMQLGMQGWSAGGTITGVPEMLARIGIAHAKLGNREDALSNVEEGLRVAVATGQRAQIAELHRANGNTLLLTAPPDFRRAMQEFELAVSAAHDVRARSNELLAATDLARLWQKQGNTERAHQLLHPIYIGFTEGFGTPALSEAKALLDELV